MAPWVLCPRMVIAVPNVYEVLLKLLDETRPQYVSRVATEHKLFPV